MVKITAAKYHKYPLSPTSARLLIIVQQAGDVSCTNKAQGQGGQQALGNTEQQGNGVIVAAWSAGGASAASSSFSYGLVSVK
jgi:hypothetical protein